MNRIVVKNTSINIITIDDSDLVSLTDIAKYKTNDTNTVIANWMRNRNTIEYLGIWETLYKRFSNPSNSRGLKIRQV